MGKLDYKGLVINQRDDVYPPCHDTFQLVETLECITDKDCLEIGCGTGVVSLVLARNGNRVTAADLNPHAVKCVEESALANGLKLQVLESDLFQSVQGKFDIIIFNPPYLPTVDDDRTGDKWQDVSTDGGIDGLEVTRRFLNDCPEHLKDEDSSIYTIISSLSPEKAVTALLEDYCVVNSHSKKHFFETITVYELRS